MSDLRSSIAICPSQTMKIQDESFEAMVQELELYRTQRKSNIMLHGWVEPPQDVSVEVVAQIDIQNVEEILKFVDPDAQLDVRRVFRVGKFNNTSSENSPEFQCSVHHILIRSEQLKKYRKHPNLFVASDCTRQQKDNFKRVTAEFERRKSDGETIQMKFIRGVRTIKPLN
ncbi:hypothetical protein WA026_021863 [Henosepilachna vigintioctopunctata]|uniref:Uncharacterized protein n=1 Tax=Henosepilachna vigintioctopunctata TaxID=420089 RepID=A0AAW1UP34_9CUCU